MYNFATGSGVSIGIIISGFIVVNNSWRVIYTVGAIMIGILLVFIIFTFPETAYNRSYEDSEEGDIFDSKTNPYRLSLSIILNDAEKARVQQYYDENDSLAEMDNLDGNTQSTVIRRMEDRIRRLEAAILGSSQYSPLSQPKTKSFWKKLALFTGETYTKDSLWKMFSRPFGLVLMPPVMWATLVMSATIGFSIALSSTCMFWGPPWS